jgi:hypothetical protein
MKSSPSILHPNLDCYEAFLNNLRLAINQNQFDALIQLCIEIGTNTFKSSELLKTIQTKDGLIKMRRIMLGFKKLAETKDVNGHFYIDLMLAEKIKGLIELYFKPI